MTGRATDEGEDTGQHNIGRTIAGRYTLQQRIARGGMGEVYLARHDLLKKTVAVKVLREDRTASHEALARFQREARAAASIGNPHIVEVTDFGFTEEGEAYLVMEHLRGQTLRALLAAEGALSAARIVAIGSQILEGLAAAHGQQIIHRDLKSDNVFLVQHGEQEFVKLLDFGISKVKPHPTEGTVTSLTSTGMIMGTPMYLAPEQAQADPNVDHRADIYAMGVMLYEMLTGEVPFSGSSALDVLMAHIQQEPTPPHLRRPDLDIAPGLQRVALKALSKSPAERHDTAEQMLQELQDPQAIVAQAWPAARSRQNPRGHAWLLAPALLAAAAAVVIWWQASGPPPQRPRPAAALDARALTPRPAPVTADSATPDHRATEAAPDAGAPPPPRATPGSGKRPRTPRGAGKRRQPPLLDLTKNPYK